MAGDIWVLAGGRLAQAGGISVLAGGTLVLVVGRWVLEGLHMLEPGMSGVSVGCLQNYTLLF